MYFILFLVNPDVNKYQLNKSEFEQKYTPNIIYNCYMTVAI